MEYTSVLTPLFVHFQKPDGTNLVHSVAQKAADLGAAVALAWFIFKLVSVVDFHLKRWAVSTDSTIDDVLAPLFGKTQRVFFNGFNDWSLDIMVIAWYHPANYWDMQGWLQRTCLEILERFNDEGIDFAFPSRTLYLANDDNRQLKLKMLERETVTYIPEGGSDE